MRGIEIVGLAFRPALPGVPVCTNVVVKGLASWFNDVVIAGGAVTSLLVVAWVCVLFITDSTIFLLLLLLLVTDWGVALNICKQCKKVWIE